MVAIASGNPYSSAAFLSLMDNCIPVATRISRYEPIWNHNNQRAIANQGDRLGSPVTLLYGILLG